MRLIILLVAIAACSKRNPEVCCETADECAVIGTQEVVACDVGACVAHECVDLGPCDGNEDCQSPETCVVGICTAPSAPPDAAMKPAFDVAYPNEWRFSVVDPVPLSIMFINTNTDEVPLSMSTLKVKSLEDDHPIAFVRIVTTPSAALIGPGLAGGKVSLVANPIFFGSGLVTEARTDESSSYGTIEIQDAPQGTYDILVTAVLQLSGLDVPLSMTVHMVTDGETIFAEPEAGTRETVFDD